MMALQGMKILFISPDFFGIDKVIIEKLEEKGADTYWLNERSVSSSFGRALNSLSPLLFYYQSNTYFKKALLRAPEQVDIIFVIKGDMITKKTITSLRKKYPMAQLVLYLYDPVVYIKGILEKVHLYDRVISFEPEDCKKYGFEFRPLFCDLKKKSGEGLKNPLYKICFYGTMYGDRFQIIEQVREICSQKGITFFSFCFLRGKFMAFYYWIKNKAFRKLGLKAVSFVPKSSSEISELVESSEIVLDANDILQKGLTLRTIETLVSGKRMITTNNDIINYDFYNEHNICIVDRNKIEIPDSFLNDNYREISEEIMDRYTAEGWVYDVFIKR